MTTTERKYIQKLEELIKHYKGRRLETWSHISHRKYYEKELEIESELSSLKTQMAVEPEIPMGETEEMDKFHHILLKSAIENRAFFTSNEFHTIWNAVQGYHAQFTTQRQVTDEEIEEWASSLGEHRGYTVNEIRAAERGAKAMRYNKIGKP